MTPAAIIRAHCLDCCGGSSDEVRKCTALDCPSWPFRIGTNPWRAPLSEAEAFPPLPTTDGRELVLTRYTQPEPELQLLINQLKFELPLQPPPRITAAKQIPQQLP